MLFCLIEEKSSICSKDVTLLINSKSSLPPPPFPQLEMGYLESILVLASILAALGNSEPVVCPAVSHACSPTGPHIRFPFWLAGRPLRCQYPGFELFCNGNSTMLRLPSLGEFVVTSIFYELTRLVIIVPKICVEGLTYQHESHPYLAGLAPLYLNYTFLNCSGNIFSYRFDSPNYSFENFDLFRCLNNSNSHHDYSTSAHLVYAISSSLDLDALPPSCQRISSVSVPFFAYNYNLISGDSSSSLELGWHVPGCHGCVHCGFRNKDGDETTCFDAPPQPYLEGTYESTSAKRYKSTKHLSLIIGLCTGLVFLMVAILGGVYLFMKRHSKKRMDNQITVEKFLEDYKSLKPMRYSYADIKKITNRFKTKLGEGGYGSVFKGLLPSGQPVAVKILKTSSRDDGEDFVNEVGTIGRIHHVNVVRLLGFCADGFKQALIYEYMPNASLAKFIFSDGTQMASLGWEKIQDIALGIARGIEYLHQGCNQRILHFDIKPHNILLDHKFCPKISDFGLAKLCSKDQSIVSMTAARGTIGYIAPEVLSRNVGNVSHKSDVYSFGMLLLEMVGGRKNIDATVENISRVYFPGWIYKRLSRGEELGLRTVTDEDNLTATRLTTVAMWCVQWYPVNRPSVNAVVQMLEGSLENLQLPPDPFASESTAPGEEVAPLPNEPRGPTLPAISEVTEEAGQEVP